jgi:hybrid polyketide synthase/nonribosomal peptide synthetase ACE1
LAAQSQGQKPAIVVAGSENFQTYDEMQLMVRKIAYALVKHGVTPGQAVAVFQDAGLDWICSMLAIMKIGAIYLPLDSSTPSTRLSMIVADCQPASIIVNRSQSTFNIPVVIDVSGFGKEPHSISEDILTQVGASDDALILYTSGTTGTPKGVVLKHSTFCHEVEVSAEVYGLDSNIVVLQQSSFGFDMSVLQIFLGLALGGTVCIVPQEFRGDAAAISDFIVRHNVTYTCATPTEYASWLRYGDRQRLKSSSWNVALSGGEAASLSLIETFHELEKSDLRLFNGYGPTETTCCSTKIQLLPDEASNYQQIVSAGSPSWNESIYIIDDQMRLLPPGLPGEIAIGGAGVAAGYLKNKELTQEAFVPDIFATLDYKQKGWTTMYRTKDRGRLQLDGTLMLEGRISGDTQVKLRGVRIDLQDIENTILRASEGSIVTACATLRDEGDTKLTIAHVVLSNSFDLKTNEIKDQYLSRLSSSLPLPLAVRPSALVRIEKMPLMSSGKLDRRAVEALPLQQSMLSTNDKQGFHMDTDKRKLTDTESRLKKIWIQVLSHSDLMQPAKITADSDFFHVGGSSILLLEVRAQIQQTFGAVLRLIQLFESSTLGAMARFIENQTVDVAVEQIDWESESLPPPDLVWQLQSNTLATVNKPPSNRLKTIVLTGAAGGLGSQILNQLLASELVGIVICIGLRKIQSRIESGALPKPSKRLTYFDGDLRQPRLGLSESNWTSIASQADAVVHIGADVSHAKTYKTVRDTNVGATVEIARLCLASRAHLHFVSSGEVAMLGHIPARIFPEESVRNADVIPSQEDAQSEGYASSKWVCERLLENVAETGSGLRVWIHRPSSITAPRDEDEEAALVGKPDAPLLRSVFFYSRKLRAVPDADGQRLGGMLDLVGVVTVARDIAHAVLHDDGNGRERVSYVHHTGDAEMALDRLHEHLSEIEKQELGDAETHLPPFQVLPLAEWVESAQGVGMHPLLAMIFENAEREKKAMYFPKFVKRSRTVAAVPE